MRKTTIVVVLLCSVVLFAAVRLAYADATDPSGPETLTADLTSRFNLSNWPTKSLNAEAGNITQVTINGVTATQTWQGYYGNITGTITLDDGFNNTMYDWYMAEPQGEIYASNGSVVTWSNIKCVNYTANITEGVDSMNLTVLETMYGLEPDDYDGVDETFNGTYQTTFYVGTYTITGGFCKMTDLYENDSANGDEFVEVLLTDNQSIIFTSIIENDIIGNDTDVYGFDYVKHDFQMIVGEDGHNGNDDVTPYYFFVELE